MKGSAWEIDQYRNGEDDEKWGEAFSAPDESFGTIGPIAAAANYYLKEDHTTSLNSELKKNFLLALVCLSGAYLYWIPAVKYAERLDLKKISWLFGIGTCIPALAVLYVATDTFLKWHLNSVIPKSLEHVLKSSQTRAARVRENIGIGLGAAISAVPLALIIFAFPPEERIKRGWLILLSTVVLIDNTILHFLPVKLVLNQDIYLLPFLPFIYLGRWLRDKYKNRNLLDQDKRQNIYNAQKASDHQQLKQLMISRISLAQARMNKKVFTWRRRGCLGYYYKLRIADEIRQLLNSDNKDNPLLLVLHFLPEALRASTQPSKVNTAFFNIARTIGAFWIWSSISGYYAAPFNQFYRWTNNYFYSGLAAALPDYSMSVLVAFFGQSIGGSLYNYVTSWGENDTKIPIAVKFYPKLFMLTMLLNVGLAPFSPAAAMELVYSGYQNYKWAKPLISPLLYLAYSGITLLALSAVRDFILLVFMKIATYGGSEDARLLANVNERIEQYKNSINYMDGDALEAELKGMVSTAEKGEVVGVGLGNDVSANSMDDAHRDLEKILGISNQSFQEIINHGQNFRNNYRPNRPWYSCFKSKSKSDEEQPLMDPMDGIRP